MTYEQYSDYRLTKKQREMLHILETEGPCTLVEINNHLKNTFGPSPLVSLRNTLNYMAKKSDEHPLIVVIENESDTQAGTKLRERRYAINRPLENPTELDSR